MSDDVVDTLLRKLEGKQVLIFDFDGTLADTSPLHDSAFNTVLAPMGVPVDYSSMAGLRTADALVQCLAKAGKVVPEEQIKQLASAKQSAVRNLVSELLEPMPGVNEFLKWAKSRFQLAMYSSGSRGTVELAVEKLGYAGWFCPMLCSEDVGFAKPHPEGYLKILEVLSVSAAKALVFEDSDPGIEAARRAGIETHDVRAVPFIQILLNQGFCD